MKFHWDADAVITETVPQNRTQPRMAHATRVADRRDQLSCRTQISADGMDALRVAAKCSQSCLCRWFAPFQLIVTEQKPVIALHPMTVALGSALASLGIEPQPYKASKIVP